MTSLTLFNLASGVRCRPVRAALPWRADRGVALAALSATWRHSIVGCAPARIPGLRRPEVDIRGGCKASGMRRKMFGMILY